MQSGTAEIARSGLVFSGISTRAKELCLAYIQLTKPRIVLLFGITGLASMFIEGSLVHRPFELWMILVGMILTASSANALNQYLDRDIDSVMDRTRNRRPLPQGKLLPYQALTFGLTLGVMSFAILYFVGNLLTAALGLATILFYIGVYTSWLKRKTPYNIVIGGAAGATAPLIGWAAATGSLSLGAWISFLIIFMWTPPHFWALALCLKEEYAKVSVPMLPVVAGEKNTQKQIFWYTVALVPLTLSLFFIGDCGWLYFISALLLGVEFLRRVSLIFRTQKEPVTSYKSKPEWKVFGFSILYLLLLYIIMIVDVLWLPKAKADEAIPKVLKDVGIEEQLGKQVDLNLMFKNEKGETVALSSVVNGRKPVILLLAYYRCPNLCNYFLNGVTDALKEFSKDPKWAIGKNYEVLTVSIHPGETPELASQKKLAHLEEYGASATSEAQGHWHFWVNDKDAPQDSLDANVKKLADQVGFKYHYDAEQDQYAHSAAMIVLTPEGKVSRYLYGIQFRSTDLKFGLVEASGGRVGSVVDHLLLFCYNYDPKTRKYSLYATNLMKAGGGLTVFILASSLLGFWRRNRQGRIQT